MNGLTLSLKEDETFRYTVAGFLGLEILKRLDRNEQALIKGLPEARRRDC